MTFSIRTPQAWLARSGASVVVSVQSLKEQTAARWEMICVPTANKLERLFRAKLGPSDRFVQIDEITWLVVMADTEIDNALACCLRIAYELHRAVMPGCELSQLKVSPATAIADNTLEATPLAGDRLRAVAHRAGLDELVTADPDEAADAADAAYRFEPVWDASHHIVSGHRCLSDGGSGAGDTVGQQLTHTRTMLRSTARILEKRLAEGEHCIVFMPIPYDVLSAPPARMELLATCRQLKCELRPLLVFEIATIGAGIPKHRLAEIVAAIQPFARAVIARTIPSNRSLMDYGGTGLKALGLELTGSAADESEICRLSGIAKRLGVTSYFTNLASERTLDQVVTLGTRWISGAVIGQPANAPAPPSRLALDAIQQSVEQPVRLGASA